MTYSDSDRAEWNLQKQIMPTDKYAARYIDRELGLTDERD